MIRGTAPCVVRAACRAITEVAIFTTDAAPAAGTPAAAMDGVAIDSTAATPAIAASCKISAGQFAMAPCRSVWISPRIPTRQISYTGMHEIHDQNPTPIMVWLPLLPPPPLIMLGRATAC